jgi:glyoxylase-like metal-dependent hydrolase (beta-lactamase superfamily II)
MSMSVPESSFSEISFREVADGVLVASTNPLDVNVTLIVGEDGALLVDTLSTTDQAQRLLAAVRDLTTKPLSVINTHFHFDHCFGNFVFAQAGCPIWAHEQTVIELAEHGEHWQRRWYAEWEALEPELAAGIADVQITVPQDLVRDSHVLDLGRRTATLVHFGHGHTAGDLVVLVQSAHADGVEVAVVGDLVEESGPPDFTDSHPLEWPSTLGRLVQRIRPDTVVVPGHGAIVDTRFVREQHNDLSTFEWIIRDGHLDNGTIDKVTTLSPFPENVSRVGVARGFAVLDDRV